VGRVVDVERAGPEVGDDAGRAETDCFHLLRAGQAGGDDLALRGQRRRRVAPFGAGGEQWLGGAAADVVDQELMGGLQPPAGDRRADIAGADEPDFHELSFRAAKREPPPRGLARASTSILHHEDTKSAKTITMSPIFVAFVPSWFCCALRAKTWVAGTSPATGHAITGRRGAGRCPTGSSFCCCRRAAGRGSGPSPWGISNRRAGSRWW